MMFLVLDYFLPEKFPLVSSVARKQGHNRFEQLLVCLEQLQDA